VSYLSQALEWMRGVLFGRRTPGKHAATHTRPAAPPAFRGRSAPDVWGARLVIARRRRAQRQAWTPYPPQPYGRSEWFASRDWEAQEAWERTGPIVRPYVDTWCEVPRNSCPGVQVDPWEHIQ
jgi:hypothetical protein